MGLDYSTEVGYGFTWPEERSEDLVRRLGLTDHEIMGWPESKLLPSLGFPGLSILECFTTGDPGGWAVALTESVLSLDPEQEDGIRMLGPAEPSGKSLEPLLRLRDQLFPEESARPEIGWFLISSIY